MQGPIVLAAFWQRPSFECQEFPFCQRIFPSRPVTKNARLEENRERNQTMLKRHADFSQSGSD